MAKHSQSQVLVIVESPTKARTIANFLPKEYVIKASIGHVRDLPNNADDIPAKEKKQAWARLGVNVAADFEPLYVVPKEKKEIVQEMRAAVRAADRIYFATDEDREGESISWHLLELLGPKVPFERLVFHEITKDAIRRSLESPRAINADLVSAQETRRIVDRLFGYEVSPLLWKKMMPRLSAGRVQSVAVRLLVERERARLRFTEASYWGLKAVFEKDDLPFEAELVSLEGKRVVVGKDFDPNTGQLRKPSGKQAESLILLDEETARRLEETARQAKALVDSVDHKPFTSSPQAPYVTSTLQQDANSKLRLSARQTMRLAQQLYENGFITYMRTDSTVLSDEAKSAARDLIVERFGTEYLSKSVRYYRNQVKNAQEAHEAIRPAGGQFQAVNEVGKRLGTEAARLYEMIWRRTLASQMPDARGTNSVALIDLGGARFRATGKTIEFAGFLKAYSAEAEAQESAAVEGKERVLPAMRAGDSLEVRAAEGSQRRTQPAPRYTEGNLIRELERLGIGRPSTWATIVDLVQSRAYAFKRGGALVPTFTAMAVVGLLEKHFTHLADYAFTARLEDQLDAIARGELQRLDYLKGFYYGSGHEGLQTLVRSGEAEIDPREVCGLPLGKAEDGTEVEVRIGRYGPFLSDGVSRCSVPDTLAPDELTLGKAREMLELAGKNPEPLGLDPATSLPVYLKQGRYGPFVQLGDLDAQEAAKPASKRGARKGTAEQAVPAADQAVKRASLLRGMDPATLDLETACRLLSLPRTLGKRGADEVVAANGRFGPFVRAGNDTRSIPENLSPLDITLDQAVALLAQERKGRRTAGRSEPLKELGKHPATDKDLRVLSGRYGPYVTDGEINASLPRDCAPEDVTVEQAVALLQARADRIATGGGAKRRRPRRQA